MESRYPIARLGDYCAKIGSGATPKGGKEVYLDSGEYSLVRSQNVLNNQFSMDGLAYISPEAAGKLSGVSVEEGDVLLNITGDSVARCCSAPAHILPARVNQHVAIIRPDSEEFLARFVRYFLVSQLQQDHMLKLASSGATRNALTKGMIEDFGVPKPNIDTQRGIEKILGDLDDKIDLLREMNRTLEEIARAVFRAWFVDFEPVRAKAAGATSFRGMPQNIFDQLPDSLIPSELGDIPEEWSVGSVSDVVELKRNSVKPFENPNEVYQHFSLPAFDRDQEPDLDSGLSIKSNKYSIPEDAILFSKLNPRIPRVWWPRSSYSDYQQIASTEFLVCVSRQDWSRAYAYCLFTQPPFIEGLTKQASGTSNSHQRIKPDQFESVKIPVSPSPIRQAFHDFAFPVLERVAANRQQNRTLAALRDTLLPMLIFGELPVPDLAALGLTPTSKTEVGDGG